MPSTAKSSKGEETRQRIVQRALELAGSVGLEGLTIGELATELGLSKSGLFAHFRSKERLQLAVLDAAAEDFAARVFVPAIQRPRGEPRVRALFDNWLSWIESPRMPGGCVFLSGAIEWDDRAGPVREAVVGWFQQLYDSLKRAASLAVSEGQWRSDLDLEQFVGEMHGIALKFHLDCRLLRHPQASERAHLAFERLLSAARA